MYVYHFSRYVYAQPRAGVRDEPTNLVSFRALFADAKVLPIDDVTECARGYVGARLGTHQRLQRIQNGLFVVERQQTEIMHNFVPGVHVPVTMGQRDILSHMVAPIKVQFHGLEHTRCPVEAVTVFERIAILGGSPTLTHSDTRVTTT
eukprot:m.886710 g.886710  ORF g.886710 m.886710 type:complete len:148 (+) comp23629_c0_seq2:2985-3428(+)